MLIFLVNHKSWLGIKFTPTIEFSLSLYKKKECSVAILAYMIVAWPFEVQPLSWDTFKCAPVYI